MVHGDDFTGVGSESALKWLEGIMATHVEVKVNMLGMGGLGTHRKW